MRIVRFAFQGKIKYGLLQEKSVKGLRGSPFSHFKHSNSTFSLDGSTYRIDKLKLLPPCLPSKIVGIGRNYRSHIEEMKSAIPPVPLIFLKPTTAVVGPDEKIILKHLTNRVDYEGELGVVIGKKAKDVPEDRARDSLGLKEWGQGTTTGPLLRVPNILT